ncbi:MAG: T9SS type A sorting domain-containing protein [Ignavibacteria bacterium]|nr:T9SS type A sorting domain-containing protein [Ignavibacteria bacterium]
MKQIFTLFLFLTFTTAITAQIETLAKWTFPSGNLSDTVAEEASTLNSSASINTIGGTGAITMKNGATTKAAQADGWDNGMGVKAWQIIINTSGFENILVNSKQQSGNTDAGPRDFKLQYKIGESDEWNDVPNGTILVANDWTTSELIDLPLPSECNNKALVFVRWVLASEFDINGVTLLPVGKTKIDDILVKGSLLIGFDDLTAQEQIRTYPNPCAEYLKIEAQSIIRKVSIYTLAGHLVSQSEFAQTEITMPIIFKKGIYLISVETEKGNGGIYRKIVVN